jgi:hypothetical protein
MPGLAPGSLSRKLGLHRVVRHSPADAPPPPEKGRDMIQMPTPQGAEQARHFVLASPPPGFVENPYPTYAALLAHAPVLPQPDGSVLMCRHADLDRIYRDTVLFRSDKKPPLRQNSDWIRRFTAITPHHWCSTIRPCTAACAASSAPP